MLQINMSAHSRNLTCCGEVVDNPSSQVTVDSLLNGVVRWWITASSNPGPGRMSTIMDPALSSPEVPGDSA